MLVIPISSALYDTFKELATSQRIVFITGLPGVGKSLLIQQMALIADELGRKVHLLQWDVSRKAFETPAVLERYPEIDGVTDPIIRKAAGLWARDAVVQWDKTYKEDEHILIGELPLIGNRLIELAEVHDDEAEALLSDEKVRFVTPVPSWEVREVIEKSREKTISNPSNEKEKLDAPPNVLRALWQEVNTLAREIGITKARPDSPYNPYIYGGVYEALLQHRNAISVLVNVVLNPAGSVYDMDVIESVQMASDEDAERIINEVESRYTRDELIEAVENWHAIITANPKVPDPGPELHLPLPDELGVIAGDTSLTAAQKERLKTLLAVPMDADEDSLLAAIDGALDALKESIPHDLVKADVHKFDVYDSYFNVKRTEGNAAAVYIAGILKAYKNVLVDMSEEAHALTVVEKPMLRIALETTLHALDL
ncbi:MAG: hypothetical protein KTR29_01840 [Rhodothermaceae bacterium]|nr:hypothetical protein [Rhodothermaceae bacterium]